MRDLLRTKLTHGKELEHAVLHVGKTVVVLVEHRLRARQIEVVVRARVPRQLGDPLEIRANDLRLHRLAAGALEAAELALDLGARRRRQLELVELLAQLADLLALIVVAELLLDRLHLLAQVHLALALAELFLHLRLDLLLHLDHADLSLHVHEHATEAVLDREVLEQPLPLRHRELDVAGYQIRELARIGHGVEHLMHDFLGQSPPLAKLGGALANLLVQRDERRVVLVGRRHLLDRGDDGAEVVVGHHVLQRRRALLTLQQQLDAAETTLDLPDARNHAHRVEDVRSGLVGVVALCDGEDEAVALEGGLDGPQRPRPPRGNGGGEARKDHGTPKREHRECLTCCHDET